MTFPYKIKVDKCVGSCNDVENPYIKVYLPDVVKNINLFVCVSLITTGTMIYFCLKSRNKSVLPY